MLNTLKHIAKRTTVSTLKLAAQVHEGCCTVLQSPAQDLYAECWGDMEFDVVARCCNFGLPECFNAVFTSERCCGAAAEGRGVAVAPPRLAGCYWSRAAEEACCAGTSEDLALCFADGRSFASCCEGQRTAVLFWLLPRTASTFLTESVDDTGVKAEFHRFSIGPDNSRDRAPFTPSPRVESSYCVRVE